MLGGKDNKQQVQGVACDYDTDISNNVSLLA